MVTACLLCEPHKAIFKRVSEQTFRGVLRRVALEERTLREELQAYDIYMAQVKYRLIPHHW